MPDIFEPELQCVLYGTANVLALLGPLVAAHPLVLVNNWGGARPAPLAYRKLPAGHSLALDHGAGLVNRLTRSTRFAIDDRVDSYGDRVAGGTGWPGSVSAKRFTVSS